MADKKQTIQSLSQFEKLQDSNYSFSSCDTCNANCCDGSKLIIYSPILLEDFQRISENFPILFLYGEKGYIRPVVLLTNGKDFCKYLENMKCSIYESRPSVCQIYPLSPHITDEIFIDNACPSVTKEENTNINNDKILEQFNHKNFNNYSDKYVNTQAYFHPYNKKENIDFAIKINGIEFYKFNKDFGQEYIKIHMDSLKHLEDDYFKKIN